ncbi:hypothetical protein LZK82_09490 [Rhizobium leguminosarum]|nr:hypothetical protein LZK82_09490 [Rhizobium leguminosarum]
MCRGTSPRDVERRADFLHRFHEYVALALLDPHKNLSTNGGIRTTGVDRATAKFGMANLAYNVLRYVFHEGRRAAA